VEAALIRLGGLHAVWPFFLEFNNYGAGRLMCASAYPPGMSSTAKCRLALFRNIQRRGSLGRVADYTIQSEPRFSMFGAYLASNRQSSVLTTSDSLLKQDQVSICTSTPRRICASTVRWRAVSGDADLRLRGNHGEAGYCWAGRNIQEGPEFSSTAPKYELERGDISFTNPVKIDPVVDLGGQHSRSGL